MTDKNKKTKEKTLDPRLLMSRMTEGEKARMTEGEKARMTEGKSGDDRQKQKD